MSILKSFRVTKGSGPPRGRLRVPGETLTSHLALVLASLTVGRSTLRGLATGEDIQVTLAALRALGARVMPDGDGNWLVDGVGIGGLREPSGVLELGRSGISARLLLGLIATHPITTVFTGDANLRDQSLASLIQPLQEIGAQFVHGAGRSLPLTVLGASMPLPTESIIAASDRATKLAVLLAALNIPGQSSVIVPVPADDLDEWLLTHFGATIDRRDFADGARRIGVFGQPELAPVDLDLPGDFGNAVFPLIAALQADGAEVILEQVGYDAEAVTLVELLRGMGADIAVSEPRGVGPRPSVDLTIRPAALTGIAVSNALVARLGKYTPILAIASAVATGRTVLPDWRTPPGILDMVAEGLTQIGVKVLVEGTGLVIDGVAGANVAGGARIDARLDHRVAMAFLALAMEAGLPVGIVDDGLIELNCPGFAEIVAALGATLFSVIE